MRLLNLVCYILCLIEIVKTVNALSCSYYEFQCAYGGCLPITKKCDGRVDCADGSDETANCDRRLNLLTPTRTIIQPPRAPPIFPSTYGKSQSTDSKCDVPSNTFLTLIDTNTNLPLIQGSSASYLTHVKYTCPFGWYRVGKETTNTCLDTWINDHPICTKMCSPIDDYTISTVCHLNGRGVAFDKPIWPGTTAKITCGIMHQNPASSLEIIKCQTDGNWDYELPKPFCKTHSCGFIDSTTRFSVNSQETEVKNAPWNVGVYKKNQNENFEHICGGTLIRTKIVISAAHCFKNSNILIKSNYITTFGKFYRDFYAKEEKIIQKKTLSKIDIPPQYDPSKDYSYDIAVLTLDDHIKFNNYIRPACLTWREGNDRYVPSGKIGNVAGWGRTNDGNFSPKLRSVDLETVDSHKCRTEKIRPTDNLAFDKFCVETAEGKNVCEGDSGSGLLISEKHDRTDCYYLWGIVSNGIMAGSLDSLLSATLRTYQRAVCDTDQVILTCPRGTSISIEVAQYSKQDDGISIDELCPLNEGLSSPKQVVIGSTNTNSNDSLIKWNSISINSSILSSGNSNNSSLKNPNSNISSSNNSNNSNSNKNNSDTINTNTTNESNTSSNNETGNIGGISSTEMVMPENCMWPNAFQYSLLQTVVEACQKKKHCKFNATPGTYGVGASGRGEAGSSSFHHRMPDPCPRVRKFVEIAYKCRPYEFRSKVACENDIVQLECNPYSRIAVYSASFGRTEYESIQCNQPQGVREETCLASYATETVMQICHGRRRCNLAADANTFGSPCHRNSRMYLKVVYTCVPKQVLKDRYESLSEIDEPDDFEGDANDLYDDDPYYKESEAIPKLQSNLTRNANSNNTLVNNSTNLNVASTIEPTVSSSNPIMTHTMGMNFENNNEKFYIILLLLATCCILICVLIIALRLIVLRKRSGTASQDQHSINSSKGETTIPNGFNDSISEIDADIDLAVQIALPSVSKSENLINYSQTSSLYGSLGPSNVSHTSSTMLLQSAQNPLLCTRQSPDIIGVTNPYMSALPPGSTASSLAHTSSGIGTIVPITSLAQYTTATGTKLYTGTNPPPTSGYIMDSDGILRRPASSVVNTQQQQQQQQQQSLPSIVIGGTIIGSGTSSSPQQNKSSINQPHHKSTVVVVSPPLSAQTSIELPFHYDGTAPRTLSTGVAQNPQFFYG